jgi:hypothetical protein
MKPWWVGSALLAILWASAAGVAATKVRVGVSAVPITPFGQNPEWKGPIQPSGVWGDEKNQIWLAGFGTNRPAVGRHDDLWARALVLDADNLRVGLVSLDLIGYFQNAGSYGVDQAIKQLRPGVKFDAVIVSSTHNHEGPDTIGLWGPAAGRDGKYLEYLRFVDRQIARALSEASDRLVEVRARLGKARPPALRALQERTGYRPPLFFDDELRVMQLIGLYGKQRGKVQATVVNWNTHPESMESENRLLTSDFPHFVREAIEKKYGGAAVYFSGDLGAVEIRGDAPIAGAESEQIGDHRFPLDPKTHRPPVSFERTQAIGEAVAGAVFDALDAGEEVNLDVLRVRSLQISAPVTNPNYTALIKAGVLPSSGEAIITTLYYVSLISKQSGGGLRAAVEFVTFPGEIFPELIYGVENFHRTDCPAANTGRPYEPAVWRLMKGDYRFVLGLAPDEFGYIVPQYDFAPLPPKPFEPGKRAPDACAAQGVPAHYHETNSVSHELAPAVTCGMVRLLGGSTSSFPACADFHPVQ